MLANQALKNGAKKVHFEYKLCGLTCFSTKSNVIIIDIIKINTKPFS